MAPTIHEIDPDADTVIVLKNACTNFADWGLPIVTQTTEEVEPSKEYIEDDLDISVVSLPRKRILYNKKSKKGKRSIVYVEVTPSPPSPPPPEEAPWDEVPPALLPEEASWEEAPPPSLPEETHAEEALEAEPEVQIEPEEDVEAAATNSKTSIFGNGSPGDAENTPVSSAVYGAVNNSKTAFALPENPIEIVEDTVHYYVSSRHLMLASPWFKRALTKEGWNESGRDKTDGRFRIAAEDWDAEALLLVLRIFHLRHRQVPRTVTLDMLAKIAILVDYYECGEALELFTDMWIDHLKKSKVPSVYSRDLVLWVWVSWVFDLVDEFKRATAVAIKQSSESMRTLELPIPMRVSEEIDSERYQVIDSAVDGVHGLLDRYRKASYVCPINSTYSFQCGSFLLGALTKELDRLGLLMPRPQNPFLGFSFDGVCQKLRRIHSPTWSEPDNGGRGYYYSNNHGCALGEEVVSVISIAEAAIRGLDVRSMKKGKGKVKA